MFNGRRQPSRGGTSRMMREYPVRFCERLGVKFPGPTRHPKTNWLGPAHSRFSSNCGLTCGRYPIHSKPLLHAGLLAIGVEIGSNDTH
jgi:hypothetical protein